MKLHRIDPRVKLIMLIGISTAALFLGNPMPLILLLALTSLILLSGGIGPGMIWRRLRGVFALIVTLFLLQCLFNRSGEPLVFLSGLTLVTDAGFEVAVLVSLRLLIIILSALIVLSGRLRDYLLALTQCKIPYEIAFMVLIAFRFLPILREEALDVLNGAQMRGLKIRKTGLKNKAGAYISIMLPVVAGAVRRAEQTSVAMEARGFRAYEQRTNMRKLKLNAGDIIYTALFCAALSTIIITAYITF